MRMDDKTKILQIGTPNTVWLSGVYFAQPHAEEVCRQSGAWGARRAGKINLLYSITQGRRRRSEEFSLKLFISAGNEENSHACMDI